MPPTDPSPDAPHEGDVRDELPHDLDARAFAGPYQFPDNSRRRVPAILYLVIAAGCVALWLAADRGDGVLVNDGFLWAAVFLALVGVYGLTSSWRMKVDERDALVAATSTIGFPAGHASAQLAWRGLRSRPTWRVLVYSLEDPPHTRAFVLVDAIDGRVVEHLVEENPEEWDEPNGTTGDTDEGTDPR
jgi:hypothetical protein